MDAGAWVILLLAVFMVAVMYFSVFKLSEL